MIRFLRLLRRFGRRTDGNAALEFVFALPVFMAVFMASFEGGMIALRQTMLDRALDVAMRDLRLGMLGESPTHDDLKTAICDAAVALPDCASSLKVTLERVDTDTWVMPSATVVCRDRSEALDPVTVLDPTPGARSEVMVVRTCIRTDVLFGNIGIGKMMNDANMLDGQGGYPLIAYSAFVNEP